jgi:diguanylate cyclase (GGDEF)-like protein
MRGRLLVSALLLAAASAPEVCAEGPPDEGAVVVDSLPKSLAGMVEFAFGDPPGGIAGVDGLTWTRIAVPGTWQSAGIAAHGFGWYRFRFRVTPEVASVPLEFVVPQIRDADEVFLDGAFVGRCGGFPPRYDKGTLQPRLYELPPTRTTLPGVHILLVRVYNPGPRAGGITAVPVLDAVGAAYWKQIFREAPFALAASAIFALGLFALFVFLRDRRQFEFLFFFFFTSGVAIYISTWLSVWTVLNVPLSLVFRLNFAHAFALSALFPLFFQHFLDIPIPGWQRAVVAVQGAGAIATLAWPRVDDLYYFLPVLYVTLALTGTRIAWALVSRWRRRVEYAGASLLGFLIILGAVLHDILQDLSIVPEDGRLRLVGPGFLVFAAIFLTVVADRMARLRIAASTDSLTGLANRRTLWDRIHLELARSKRGGKPLSLAVLDLDLFKEFNDRYGHLAGDRLLIAMGETLTRGIRETDLASRYGGEEFVVLLPEIGREEAATCLERIREAVSRIRVPGADRATTVSIGLAVHLPGDETPVTTAGLLRGADSALYRAKADGRNRIVVLDGSPAETDGVRFSAP